MLSSLYTKFGNIAVLGALVFNLTSYTYTGSIVNFIGLSYTAENLTSIFLEVVQWRFFCYLLQTGSILTDADWRWDAT